VNNQLKEDFDNGKVTLKDYFEMRIAALEKATEVSAAQLERRLEGMNEFRAQLKDQAAGFFPRSEHEIYTKKVDDDIRLLRESKAMLEGKASQLSVNITLFVAVIGIIVSIASAAHEFTSAFDRQSYNPPTFYITPTNSLPSR
jgi:hypothetical protein